jgi:hypothetical protein
MGGSGWERISGWLMKLSAYRLVSAAGVEADRGSEWSILDQMAASAKIWL